MHLDLQDSRSGQSEGMIVWQGDGHTSFVHTCDIAMLASFLKHSLSNNHTPSEVL